MSELIRLLARSEACHAMNGIYSGRAVRASGPLDVESLSAAVSALGVAHSVLSSRIERDEEGQPVLVEGSSSEFHFSRCWGHSEDRMAGMPPLDGQVGVVHVVHHDADTWSMTLLTHDSAVDGPHMMKILTDLWTYYTEATAGRRLWPRRHGIPRPPEGLPAPRNAGFKVPSPYPAPCGSAVDAGRSRPTGDGPVWAGRHPFAPGPGRSSAIGQCVVRGCGGELRAVKSIIACTVDPGHSWVPQGWTDRRRQLGRV